MSSHGFLIFWAILTGLCFFLLCALYYLIKLKKMGGLLNFSILTVTLLILFFAGEVGFRTYDSMQHSVSFTTVPNAFRDSQLGWTGKKVFGDPHSKKYKILVVGDSFTDGMGVDEQSMYYEVIRKRFDAELFVYGGAGYGNFQEYMIIDQSIDEIMPDLIVLQVTANDFVNNYWELESESAINNNHMVRPYYDKGKARYLYPGRFGKLRIFLTDHSRLFYRFFGGIDRLLSFLAARQIIYSVEAHINEKGLQFQPLEQSVLVTEELIVKLKHRIRNIPLVAFSVSPGFLAETFEELFTRQGCGFIGNVPDVISKAESQGAKLRMADGAHWNAKGHELAGVTLADQLNAKGYLKNTAP